MVDISQRISEMRTSSGSPRVLRKNIDAFEESLWKNAEALSYLKNTRNLTEESLKHFHIGYDEEKKAIVIPIFKGGRLIDIKYRTIGEDKKYFRETGSESWIFNEQGIEEAKKKGAILIVEGEIDAISIYQAGITNVISPTSGVSAIGRWIDFLENIPRVYICFDNDVAGQRGSHSLAERIGPEKVWEVSYPEGVKDANEFFKQHDVKDFRENIKNAKRALRRIFPHISDIVKTLRTTDDFLWKIPFLDIPVNESYVILLVGKDNAGKTTVAVNLAIDLVRSSLSTLVLPFERGTSIVGKRTITAAFDIRKNEEMETERWDDIEKQVSEWPMYFYEPQGDEYKEEVMRELMIKAKKYFGIQALVIDHLDYLVQKHAVNEYSAQGIAMRNIKDTAMETGQVVVVAHQSRKVDSPSAKHSRLIRKEDASGSHRVFNIAEVVVLLHDYSDHIALEVAKNKGEATTVNLLLHKDSGKITGVYEPDKEVTVVGDTQSKNVSPETIAW